MSRIKIMVNGIPGNMASKVAEYILKDSRFELIPFALTGPEITETHANVASAKIQLIQEAQRDEKISKIKKEYDDFITVDYSHPSAVNLNAEFYCKNRLPFVMGTTGGDRKLLADTVSASAISAVIAPNMAKQIVGFQAMMEYAAENFPNLFAGYKLKIKESHQKGKADTSGTAKAMVAYFNKLGIPFTADRIQMERDPEIQKNTWGIPEAYLSGHGWHTYSLESSDGTVHFEFTHKVNGRDIYVPSTLDAVLFLKKQLDKGAKGQVFSMIDVLKG